jgi:hypothetical protein
MKTLELALPEQTAIKLQEAAQKLGLMPEELLQISVEEKLARLDAEFLKAATYVIEKNDELYKRLA